MALVQFDNEMATQTKPIILYAFPSPNGRKISVMLEELSVPYDYKFINIRKREQFTPELIAMSPNNKMPVIYDPAGPDGEPISVFETGAILIYLGEKFGRFYPPDIRARTAIDQWLFWQVSGVGPMLGQAEHYDRFAPEKVPYAIKRYKDEAHRLFGVLNRQLEGRDYIANDVSIADFAMIGWANTYQEYDISLAEFPHFANWRKRMNDRPATQRGIDALKSI